MVYVLLRRHDWSAPSEDYGAWSLRGTCVCTIWVNRTKEKEVNRNCNKKFLGGATARNICGSLAALAVLAVSGTAFAQDNQDKKL
jgi:hypothetical protein